MNKAKAGYLEGIVSVFVNTTLFGLKFWAGFVTGSVALIADAWHTLSDSLSSVVVIVAVKLSSKKPDREHPFGHGRWEQIAALFIAFLLAVIAYGFLKDSVLRLKNQESVQFGAIAIVVTIVSILVKEALARYAFYIGKKTDNVSVKADGWHHRTDALSSVVVLAGIFLAGKFWWIDSVLGIAISMMLFYATFNIAREAIGKLLGEKPGAALIEKITELVQQHTNSDLQLHHFHIHNYVGHQELTFHVRLNNELSIEEGHRVATGIEDVIHRHLNIVSTIHVEPLHCNHHSH